jgi:hypothetical protein
MIKTYVASKNILSEQGKVLVKKGDVALTLDVPDALGEAKALAGLHNGTLIPAEQAKKAEEADAKPEKQKK